MSGGISGPELAEKAVQMQPKIKVLYTSGYTEHGDIQEGQLNPGIPLLHKPYKRHDLAQMLRLVLTQSS